MKIGLSDLSPIPSSRQDIGRWRIPLKVNGQQAFVPLLYLRRLTFFCAKVLSSSYETHWLPSQVIHFTPAVLSQTGVSLFLVMISEISWSSRIPAVPEQGPALAPPLNSQTPFGLLHDASFNVKERPYYLYFSHTEIHNHLECTKQTHPSLPKHDFGSSHACSPQESESQVNLCQVRVRRNIRSDELRIGIPRAVEVIRHEIKPPYRRQQEQISRRSNGETNQST